MSELPRELVVGWVLWVLGGLLLTLWFLRASAAPRSRELAAMGPPSGGARLSGTHRTAAPQPARTHAAAPPPVRHAATRPDPGTRGLHAQPPGGTPVPDAFDELRALLDGSDDSPHAR